MRSFDPDALECLAAIVEEGGFERAAVRLSITQSAVSQRLRSLEAQVGTVLLVRSRPLKPTSAGRLLLKHAMQMRLLRADLDTDLQDLAPGTGTLREEDRISIAINADSISTWALARFKPAGAGRACRWKSSPMTRISPTNGCARGWCWAASPPSARPLRGCKVLPLGAMHYVAVAGAHYAQEHCPEGITPHNFRNIPFIAFNRKDDLQAEFLGRVCGLKHVAPSLRFVPSSEGQVRAALAGWGATVVPELQVRVQLASGELVNLAPDVVLPVQLYWHCWNLDSAVIDKLTRALG